MNVPFGAFMPDRVFVPGSTSPNEQHQDVDLPVNVGVIKCGNELILYDSGWKQQDYLTDDRLGPLGRAARAARAARLRAPIRSPRS